MPTVRSVASTGLVIAVLATTGGLACGGSETPEETSDVSAPASASESLVEQLAESAGFGEEVDDSWFSSESIALVDALIEVHADEALEVLVHSLERGYSLEQIEAGVAEGVVGVDGSFGDGTSPNGPPAGVIALPDEAGERVGDGAEEESLGDAGPPPSAEAFRPIRPRRQRSDDTYTVDVLREVASGAGTTSGEVNPDEGLALFIVALVRDGYSLRQITEAIVLGTAVPLPFREETNHMCLFGVPSGVLILPEVPIGENALCADTSIGRSPGSTTTTTTTTEPIDEAPSTDPVDATDDASGDDESTAATDDVATTDDDATDDADVDAAPSARWVGDLEYQDETVELVVEVASVEITRDANGVFAIDARLQFRTIVVCGEFERDRAFVGSGELGSDGRLIQFVGAFDETASSTCPDANVPAPTSDERVFNAELVDGRIVGAALGADFDLSPAGG